MTSSHVYSRSNRAGIQQELQAGRQTSDLLKALEAHTALRIYCKETGSQEERAAADDRLLQGKALPHLNKGTQSQAALPAADALGSPDRD